MKKTIKNLIFILTLVIYQSAFCYTLTSNELNKIIYNKINSETKKELGNVEFKLNINAQLHDVVTNETTAPQVQISSSGGFNPVSYRRVIIKDSKGNVIKTIPVNIHTLIYMNVLVANENINYDKKIDLENTKFEKREVSKCYERVITELSDNIVASRNILKGNIIQKNSIKQKPIIEKNQNVDIVFQGKGMQITMQGKALNEGAYGDKVLVRSDKYNKIYTAKVNSNSKVIVRM